MNQVTWSFRLSILVLFHRAAENLDERVLSWHKLADSVREDHPQIIKDWSSYEPEIRIRRNIHLNYIRKCTRFPLTINRLLTFIDCYLQQRNDAQLHSTVKFAEEVLKTLLKELGVKTDVIVTFADGFFTHDGGKSCIFTLPYTSLSHYRSWAILAHEAGHLISREWELQNDDLAIEILQQLEREFKEDWNQQGEVSFEQVYHTVTDFLTNHIPEVVSDHIALLVFGAPYVYEMYFDGFLRPGLTVTHPSTVFRLAVMAETGERMGLNMQYLENFRKDENIGEVIIDRSSFAPLIADWLSGLDEIKGIKSNGLNIREQGEKLLKGEAATGSLLIQFGALALASIRKEVQNLFESFKREVLYSSVI